MSRQTLYNSIAKTKRKLRYLQSFFFFFSIFRAKGKEKHQINYKLVGNKGNFLASLPVILRYSVFCIMNKINNYPQKYIKKKELLSAFWSKLCWSLDSALLCDINVYIVFYLPPPSFETLYWKTLYIFPISHCILPSPSPSFETLYLKILCNIPISHRQFRIFG